MRLSAASFILISALFVSGCVPSLNPLYTEADLTMDPSLVGTWIEKETGESWTLSSFEKFKYSLVHVDTEGQKLEYDARLVKVGDKLFLDTVPAKASRSQHDPYRDRFVATHTFVHIVLKDWTIQISYLEPKWLKDFLAENPDAIRHSKINGEVILTSSAKETQQFLLEHMTTRDAFAAPTEMTRKRGGL